MWPAGAVQRGEFSERWSSSTIVTQLLESAEYAEDEQSQRDQVMSNGPSGVVAEARQLLKNKDYEAAVTTLRDGLSDDVSHRAGWEMLGALLFRLKRHNEAAGAFRQLTRMSPRDAGAWVNLGAVLNVLKDFEGAVTALRKAIQRDKASGVAYYNLGIAQLGRRQPKIAISAYEECLRLEPENTVASVNLGNLLLEQKHYRKAAKVGLEALQYAPASTKLQRLQSRAEAGIRDSQLKLPPFGRLVDEKTLAHSQATLSRRELSRTYRNQEREFMRKTARKLRHAVRPMVPVLDDALPKQMHKLHLTTAWEDSRNESFAALEGLTFTISELARMREAVSELVAEIRSHLRETDPGR